MNPNCRHPQALPSTASLRTPSAFALGALLAAILAPETAGAQSLDVVFDAAIGSGLLLGTGDDGAAAGRTPLYLEVEAGFIFDRDVSIEYTLGVMAQLEDTPGVGITPQVKLLRDFGPLIGFASAGVPAFLFPFTRFGVEVGSGLLWPLVPKRFAVEAQLQFDAFFGGSDLPADSTVLMFNFGLGGRVWF